MARPRFGAFSHFAIRNPVIRGEFVFHCHILDHEDKGMMAKIQAT
jgi:FtsP/CotA-like multicopper oxidase with cupredoxin domain